MHRSVDEYLVDERHIWGDDFAPHEVASWLNDEQEAYADLALSKGIDERKPYEYHALNWYHGFRSLTGSGYHVAGIGAADGRELAPLEGRVSRVTVIEPSPRFVQKYVAGVSPEYRRPKADGGLPLPDASCDIVTSLGVLHHIPKVTAALKEIHRVLKPGGVAFIREPIVSMGDWRVKRPGLTSRERGLPLRAMRTAISGSGLVTERESLCMFPLMSRWARLTGLSPYNSRAVVVVDALLSRAFVWNYRYHATNPIQKLRPTSCFYLLRRPLAGV